MSRLEICNVSRVMGGKIILDNVSLTVFSGQICVLLGPSGSGKSTLLRCINHLERIDAGLVRVDDDIIGYRKVGRKLFELPEREIARQRARIGMVFQQYNLFSHLTVMENILLAPLKILNKNRQETMQKALELLETVGLQDYADVSPSFLSGGQQQRIAIVRALIMDPEIMLFDEPTAALDSELVQEVTTILRQLAEKRMTLVVVTHELGFARSLGGSVAFMDKGKIVEHIPSERLFTNL